MLKLTSTQKVVKILKPTKAKFFKSVKIGDILTFTYEIRRVKRGIHHAGLHASVIVVTNVTQGVTVAQSPTNLFNRLSCFEFKCLDIDREHIIADMYAAQKKVGSFSTVTEVAFYNEALRTFADSLEL